MVLEVIQWGIEPAGVTGDSWYSSLENLKFLRNEKVGFLFGIASNRNVSVERGTSLSIKDIDIPDDGLMVYVKAFGWVKVFCQPFKNEPRYYILYQSDFTTLEQLTHDDFKAVHDDHWKIECFHRVIKQVSGLTLNSFRDQR